MIVRFIEATQAGSQFNHGKFMLARFAPEEVETKTALPDYETESLWRCGGLRKLRPGMTLVVDLQTGEGASFSLVDRHGNPHDTARYDLDKHDIWVCPMFRPFLGWLYAQKLDEYAAAALATLPRYVEIDTQEGDFRGYRRTGGVENLRLAVQEAIEDFQDLGSLKEADIKHHVERLSIALGIQGEKAA